MFWFLCASLSLFIAHDAHASQPAAGHGAAAPPHAGPSPVTAQPAYRVSAVTGDGLAIGPPLLPDLSPYTPQAVTAKISRKIPPRVAIRQIAGETSFREFSGTDERLREWAKRQGAEPSAIIVESGYATPRELARSLPKTAIEETEPGVFVARLPILVSAGATLHLDATTKELRLSMERGAFLVNDGFLFVTESALVGWSEQRGRVADFVDPQTDFRPFLTAWGGSQTYIVNSRVASLGYADTKSYGISISQYSPATLKKFKHEPAAPTGWFLNSEFVDLWYGFYCYEAEDFVIRGNVYHDNILYGIDPHDRSKRLIIAQNRAYNTKHRHGIIISREVSDSWIFENESYENHESGIALDRQCRNNVVAYNKTYRNTGNGITVYESPDNLIWQNLSIGNSDHGFYVRNSTGIRLYDNVAIGNRLAGVYALSAVLVNIAHPRDMVLDPYTTDTSLVVVGGQLTSNGLSPVTIHSADKVLLYDVEFNAPRRPRNYGIKFQGAIGAHQDEVLDILVRQHKAVVLERVDSGTEHR